MQYISTNKRNPYFVAVMHKQGKISKFKQDIFQNNDTKIYLRANRMSESVSTKILISKSWKRWKSVYIRNKIFSWKNKKSTLGSTLTYKKIQKTICDWQFLSITNLKSTYFSSLTYSFTQSCSTQRAE